MGYVYEVTWSGALSGNVDIVSVKSKQDLAPITNKWNGGYEWVSGARFFDASVGAGEYQEVLGKVSNNSVALYVDLDLATTSDYIYFKTVEPAIGTYLGIVPGNSNATAGNIDLIEFWDGTAWTTVGTLTDGTLDEGGDSSLSQSGLVSWNATALTPIRRTFQGDNVAGFWYRISWDLALTADTRLYFMAYASFPESLSTYKGCIEFKNRLFLWGGPEWPNRLRFSSARRPDSFSGTDSGWTRPVGGSDEIIACVKFYNELVVFKKNSIYLLEGEDPRNFGMLEVSTTVGLASPKTAHTIEVGTPGLHRDESLSIVMFQDTDGIYVIDGRKPKKVSAPIDRYFNQEYTESIAANEINNRQAYVDPLNGEYHLLLSSIELVYNYVINQWYPPWTREIPIDTGITLHGTDNRYYTYAGSSSGFVVRLENDTVDRSTANAEVAISHSIKTRAITAEPIADRVTTLHEVLLSFTVRHIWAEFKAQTAGSPVTKFFENQISTGIVESVPSALSMVKSGYTVTFPFLDISQEDCNVFQLEFSLSVIDQEMEIRSFQYELEARGLAEL